jgi:hypothetical protein
MMGTQLSDYEYSHNILESNLWVENNVKEGEINGYEEI